MPKLQSISPSNYQLLGEVEVSSPEEIVEKVRLAHRAKKDWAGLGVPGRVQLLQNLVEEFEARREEIILLESREMGRPIKESRAVFENTLGFPRWYFDNAEWCLSPETTYNSDTEIHRVYREPRGIAAVIIPWNYPFRNFIVATFQSLVSGNVVVMKHSEECPLSGRLIEEIAVKHLPPGVFSEVYGDGSVGQTLVEQDINLISFIGSTQTGKWLYRKAGEKFIHPILEMGGSAPGIIFEDADIDAAVKSVSAFRLANAGQNCVGLKRLIVHESIFEEIVQKLTAIFLSKRIGVAEDETTELGPLVARRQLYLLEDQLEDAKAKGARIVTGGKSLESKLGGAFFQPTLLAFQPTIYNYLAKTLRVWQEEVFGPILPVVPFHSEERAIDLANNTPYGLGSYIYTGDLKRAYRVAGELQTGGVSINGITIVTPWNPFGGCKDSGIGREHGKYGFQELTQMKTVVSPKE